MRVSKRRRSRIELCFPWSQTGPSSQLVLPVRALYLQNDETKKKRKTNEVGSNLEEKRFGVDGPSLGNVVHSTESISELHECNVSDEMDDGGTRSRHQSKSNERS